MSEKMIEIKNVSKWYGPVQVLNDCSVSIAKGDVVVVCGPSGSGKSTLIKTVNALEPFVVMMVAAMGTGSVAMWALISVGLFHSVMFPTIFTLGIKGLGPLKKAPAC